MELQILLDQAAIAYREGRTTDAIRDLKIALKELEKLGRANASSPYPGVLGLLGNAYARLGRHDEAVRAFQACCALAPNVSELHANMANSFMALGDYASAIKEYEEALRLNPDDRVAKANLPVTRELKENQERGGRIVNLDLGGPGADSYNQGAFLHKMGRYEEALSWYDRALELDSNLWEAWCDKGAVLTILGRYEQALVCFDRALETSPRDEKSWSNKGAVLAELDRWEESLACYDRALKINARYQIAWFNKGTALFNGFQHYPEALMCFEEAHRLGYPQAAQAIALCRQRLGLR